jgi:hypothetical protein
MFYNAYILSHLDYCCISFCNRTSFLQDKLIKFQNWAGRLILDKDYDTPSAELFSELCLMIFSQRVVFQKAIMMLVYWIIRRLSIYWIISFYRQMFMLAFCVHLLIFNFTPLDQILNNFLSLLFILDLVFGTVFLIISSLLNWIDYIKSATSVNHFKTLYLR